MVSRRSTAISSTEAPIINTRKRGCGRPAHQTIQQLPDSSHVEESNTLLDINESLPSPYLVRRRQHNRHVIRPVQRDIVQPDAPIPFDKN